MLANELRHPSIDADRGSYYLGATAPDIRVLTRRDRAETHFFSLNDFTKQDSVGRMFDAYPYLRDSSALDPTTRAFMAGYVTHLLMDQRYIETIYREFFGATSVYGEEPLGNVLDRVLQYEMERREREDRDAMAEIQTAISTCGGGANVEFIEPATLLQWREVAADIASHPPTWDRFRRLASRHLEAAGLVTEEQMQAFHDDLPNALHQALDRVGEQRIDEFLSATLEDASEQVQEYLG
jgi:hypothetical protein